MASILKLTILKHSILNNNHQIDCVLVDQHRAQILTTHCRHKLYPSRASTLSIHGGNEKRSSKTRPRLFDQASTKRAARHLSFFVLGTKGEPFDMLYAWGRNDLQQLTLFSHDKVAFVVI